MHFRSHVLCTQAIGVAVSGSYAYVAAPYSDSLVVVDISNPAIPVIRGSVVSSSLLDHVRVTQGHGAWMASGAALESAPSMMLARPWRGRCYCPLALSLIYSHVPVRTGLWRRRERLVRLRGGASFRLAGGDRHQQPCVSSHPGQRGLLVTSG